MLPPRLPTHHLLMRALGDRVANPYSPATPLPGAPSQHVFQYRTSVLVGAGIGVTPCASIMKGVVNYRWKKGFEPNNLHFFWVARLTDLTTFKWLLVMLPELKPYPRPQPQPNP